MQEMRNHLPMFRASQTQSAASIPQSGVDVGRKSPHFRAQASPLGFLLEM